MQDRSVGAHIPSRRSADHERSTRDACTNSCKENGRKYHYFSYVIS